MSDYKGKSNIQNAWGRIKQKCAAEAKCFLEWNAVCQGGEIAEGDLRDLDLAEVPRAELNYAQTFALARLQSKELLPIACMQTLAISTIIAVTNGEEVIILNQKY